MNLRMSSLKGLRQSRRALRSIYANFPAIPGFTQLHITIKAGPLPRLTLAPKPSTLARLLGVTM